MIIVVVIGTSLRRWMFDTISIWFKIKIVPCTICDKTKVSLLCLHTHKKDYMKKTLLCDQYITKVAKRMTMCDRALALTVKHSMQEGISYVLWRPFNQGYPLWYVLVCWTLYLSWSVNIHELIKLHNQNKHRAMYACSVKCKIYNIKTINYWIIYACEQYLYHFNFRSGFLEKP